MLGIVGIGLQSNTRTGAILAGQVTAVALGTVRMLNSAYTYSVRFSNIAT